MISNILQANLWITKYAKKCTSDYIILPLYLFFDDIEVGNPLGSHAGVNKFGVLYVSLACLPPHLASKLNTIIFSTIFHTSDKKRTDNESAFKHIIDEINYLQK